MKIGSSSAAALTLALALTLIQSTTGQALAQGPSSAASASPASPAKKELVARLVKLHEPAFENLGRTLAEQSVQQMVLNARATIVRLPQDKRETVARALEGDVRRYLEETVPLLRDRAVSLAPATMGALFEERFNEEELRQLIATLESPVSRKYQAIAGEMQRALGGRLVAETKGAVEPKLLALEQAMAGRLRAAMQAAAPAASAGGK